MMVDANVTKATRLRYDRLAPVYDAVEGLPEFLFQRSMRQRLWSLVPANQILEVGVGTGKNIPYYPANADVTAVDLSDEMLARACRRASQGSVDVDLHQMDVQDLRFEDGSFDTVVATFVHCAALSHYARRVTGRGCLAVCGHGDVATGNRPGRLFCFPYLVFRRGAGSQGESIAALPTDCGGIAVDGVDGRI